MSNYDDIINLKRPISKRESMSLENRAAQFAPFSALSGYSEACREVERITDNKKMLSDESKDIINEKLNYIKDKINNDILVNIKYFVNDSKKYGGTYIEKSGYIKKINVNEGKVYFKDGCIVCFDDILMININS
ncbi:MAG: hypothetical protein J6C28_02310 [Bacilli bacterium]|nr:hypothetical protein [Bacilli bacterium]